MPKVLNQKIVRIYHGKIVKKVTSFRFGDIAEILLLKETLIEP